MMGKSRAVMGRKRRRDPNGANGKGPSPGPFLRAGDRIRTGDPHLGKDVSLLERVISLPAQMPGNHLRPGISVRLLVSLLSVICRAFATSRALAAPWLNI
jgi:hypothetical protein